MVGIAEKQMAKKSPLSRAKVSTPDGKDQAKPGDEQPAPEEQEAYERIEIAAMEILHDEATHASILQTLQAGADSPAETLAEVAMMVFGQIDEKSGNKIPEGAMLQGALKVLDLTAELAESSGVMQVDDTVRGQAVQQMLMVAAKMGYISEDDIPEIQQMIQSMDQGEVQNMVAQQEQYASGGGMNG